MVEIKIMYKTELKKNKKIGIRVFTNDKDIIKDAKGEFWFDATKEQAEGFILQNGYTVELGEKEYQGKIYYDLLSMKKLELKEEPKAKVGITVFEEDEGTDKGYRDYQVALRHECEIDAGEFGDVEVARDFFNLRCKHYHFWTMEKARKEKVV